MPTTSEYPGGDAPDDEINAARAAALARLLSDDARLKVAAAGPGTGKTHTFNELVRPRDEIVKTSADVH